VLALSISRPAFVTYLKQKKYIKLNINREIY